MNRKKRKQLLAKAASPIEPQPRKERSTVRVGDVVWRKPDTIASTDPNTEYMKGVVVYVHPKGRFHTVEFTFSAGKIRECFSGIVR